MKELMTLVMKVLNFVGVRKIAATLKRKKKFALMYFVMETN